MEMYLKLIIVATFGCLQLVRGYAPIPTVLQEDKSCDDGKGICVALHNCLNGKFNIYGANVINIRLNENECNHYLETCCSPKQISNSSFGPGSGGPNSGGPNKVGPNTDGSNKVGPNNGGPNKVGPNTDGSNKVGPNNGGPNKVGPNTDGPNKVGPNTDGSNKVGPNTDGSNKVGPNTDGSNKVEPNTDGSNKVEPNTDGSNTEENKGSPSPPSVIPSRSCGYRNSEGTGFRISNNIGGESQFGEFPWMAAVMHQKQQNNGKYNNVYQCGGSIIHPKVVLTAAHGVSGIQSSTLAVRVGEWDTQTNRELYAHADYEVNEIIVHENFGKEGLLNDIALLILADSIQFFHHIQPICLPPQDTNFDFSRCFASGWGKDLYGQEGKYQVILKKVEVPIVPSDTCKENLRNTALGKFFVLHNSFICAGGEAGEDTCTGDGGSPLVCPVKGVKGHYYQAGIVAWGMGCGEDTTPGVYVNVAKFRNWIDYQVSSRGLQKQYYTF